MNPLRLWGTVILSLMAASALVAGFSQLADDDGPVLRLNGPAGTLLFAPFLLAIVARFWHRVRPINWGEKTDTVLSFAEPWLNYISTVALGACLIVFGALGFFGYHGKTVELVFDALLLLVGMGLLVHKLRRGRAGLVLSPTGLGLQHATPVAWDRITAARMSRRPWTTEIVIELRQQDRIRLLPTLLGADPADLLRAIEVRRTAYTF